MSENLIKIPANEEYIIGVHNGNEGSGDIILSDIFPAFQCSHYLYPDTKYKETIGITITEMRFSSNNGKTILRRTQYIPPNLVLDCMWKLYCKLARDDMKKVFPREKEIDLFGHYVCVLLKNKFKSLDDNAWSTKIIQEFNTFQKNLKEDNNPEDE